MHVRGLRLILTLSVSAVLLVPAASAQTDAAADSSRPRGRWIAHAGVGAPHAWNFVGVTREWGSGRFRPFVTAGFGTILIGGGAAYYTNPGGTGLLLAGTAGLAGAHASVALDLPLSRRSGLALGGSYGTFFLQYRGFLPVAALKVRL